MLTYIFVIGFPPTLYLCKDRILVPRVFDQMIYSQTLSFSKSVTVTAVITVMQHKTKPSTREENSESRAVRRSHLNFIYSNTE